MSADPRPAESPPPERPQPASERDDGWDALRPLRLHELPGFVIGTAAVCAASSVWLGGRDYEAFRAAWRVGPWISWLVAGLGAASCLGLVGVWVSRAAPRWLATLGLFQSWVLAAMLASLHVWRAPGDELLIVLLSGFFGGVLPGGLFALSLAWDDPFGSETALTLLCALAGLLLTAGVGGALMESYPAVEWLMSLETLAVGGALGGALGRALAWWLPDGFDRLAKLIASATAAGIALRLTYVAGRHLASQ